MRACQGADANLNSNPPPDAGSIARAVYTSILRRAEMAGLEVGESEKSELAVWICCEDQTSKG